ncbi:conjugal transfer protein TrbL family protein [Thermoflavimicrobium dichotomicum]|uniref:Uncharacterized protein n=1 Tax=Thermoflavimicrobium dichotomicum TaxID=46223 RepID=A0A1I3K6G1_9BACL|nr:conjugal transfer protein TrbL family protein [Thermoflavimicrobium dichotomicum]SFI68052.1 hypothetical protein SAMN05421852_101351 [Thermoflavimicrobium dichotomicum]
MKWNQQRRFSWYKIFVALFLAVCLVNTFYSYVYAQPSDPQNQPDTNQPNTNQPNTNQPTQVTPPPPPKKKCPTWNLICRFKQWVTGEDEDVNKYKELKEQREKELGLQETDYASLDDCGLNVFCHLKAFMKSGTEVLISLEMQTLKFFLIDKEDLKKQEFVQRYFEYLRELSWTMLTTFMTFHSIRALALYYVHEDQSQLKYVIYRVFVTGGLIVIIPELFSWFLNANNLIVRGLVDQFELDKVRSLFFNPVESVFVLIIVSVALVCMLFVFTVQYVLRLAEIAFLFMISPIVAATNMNEEYNYFPMWWRYTLVTLLTQSVQVLLFVLFVQSVASAFFAHFSDLFTKMLYMVSFMFLIIRTPRLFKEWTYVSQGGQSWGSTVRTVGNMTLSITRIGFLKLLRR